MYLNEFRIMHQNDQFWVIEYFITALYLCLASFSFWLIISCNFSSGIEFKSAFEVFLEPNSFGSLAKTCAFSSKERMSRRSLTRRQVLDLWPFYFMACLMN